MSRRPSRRKEREQIAEDVARRLIGRDPSQKPQTGKGPRLGSGEICAELCRQIASRIHGAFGLQKAPAPASEIIGVDLPRDFEMLDLTMTLEDFSWWFLHPAAALLAQSLNYRKPADLVELELPQGLDMAGRIRDSKTGVAVRIIRGYDIQTNSYLWRADIGIA